MTLPYTPPGEFRAENGAAFRYAKREDGGLQVSILSAQGELLAGFPLAVDQVMALYHELDFCPDCGEAMPSEYHGTTRCTSGFARF